MTDYAKCKVAELKKLLKERGQTGAGEKEELVTRMRLWEAGEKHKLPDGRNPTALKAAEFRKLLAQRGLPCDLSIESRDALMQRLTGMQLRLAVACSRQNVLDGIFSV